MPRCEAWHASRGASMADADAVDPFDLCEPNGITWIQF
jgi:hypothetical protein